MVEFPQNDDGFVSWILNGILVQFKVKRVYY